MRLEYCSNFSRFIKFQSRQKRRASFLTRQNFTHISTNKWSKKFFIDWFISYFINLLINAFVVKNNFIIVLSSWQSLMIIFSNNVNVAFIIHMSSSNVFDKVCWRNRKISLTMNDANWNRRRLCFHFTCAESASTQIDCSDSSFSCDSQKTNCISRVY